MFPMFLPKEERAEWAAFLATSAKLSIDDLPSRLREVYGQMPTDLQVQVDERLRLHEERRERWVRGVVRRLRASSGRRIKLNRPDTRTETRPSNWPPGPKFLPEKDREAWHAILDEASRRSAGDLVNTLQLADELTPPDLAARIDAAYRRYHLRQEGLISGRVIAMWPEAPSTK